MALDGIVRDRGDADGITVLERHLAAADHSEEYRRSIGLALAGSAPSALLLAGLAVSQLGRAITSLVSANAANASNLTTPGAAILFSVLVGAFCGWMALVQARAFGRLLAHLRRVAPPPSTVPGLNAGPMRWRLVGGSVHMDFASETESYALATLDAARAKGRVVRLGRRDGRYLFAPMAGPAEARDLARRLRAGRREAILPFAHDNAGAARRVLTAEEVQAARTAANGGRAPAGVPGPLFALACFLLYPLIAWIQLAPGPANPLAPTGLAPALGLLALAAFVCTAPSDLSTLRASLTSRRGLRFGMHWGPVVASADLRGLDMFWTSRSRRLAWEAVEGLSRAGDLLVVRDRAGGLEVVPEPANAAVFWAAAQASQPVEGTGPWARRASPAPATIVEIAVPTRPRLHQQPLVQLAFWVLLFLVVTMLAKMAGAEVLPTQPAPAWDDPVPVEPWDPVVDPGRRSPMVLSDTQIRLEGDTEEHLHRWVAAASDRSRMEWAGEVEIDLDPTSETLALHYVRIRRDGAIQDVSGLNFEVLRRETQLPDGVMNGTVTYRADVPGLLEGDLVDVSWSIRRTPHIFPGRTSVLFDPTAPGRGAVMRRRVLLPEDTAFQLQADRLAPSRADVDGWTVLEWRVAGTEEEPTEEPDPAPWDTSNDPVGLTTFANWAEITAGLATPYAPAPRELPENLRQAVATIAARTPDPDLRATEALRLVQDQVRYLSLAIGEGGWLARRPAEVWDTRFGDCKDKALLLVSILAELGMEADVVLVDTWRGRALDRAVPTPFAFDHAIVRVRSPAGDWFLDPTQSLQGGVGREVAVESFGWGLPLSPGSGALVPVGPATRFPASPPGREVEQRFRLQRDGDLAAVLDLTLTWRGTEADYQRWLLSGEDLQEWARSEVEWYGERFPGARLVGPVTLDDDLDRNELRVVLRLDLPAAGFSEKGLWQDWNLYAYAVGGEIEDLGEGGSLRGVTDMGPPRAVLHRVVLEGLAAPLAPPTQELFENAFARYVRTGSADPAAGTWSHEWRLDLLRTDPGPGDETGWQAAEAAVDESDHYRLNLSAHVLALSAERPVLAGLRLADAVGLGLALALLGPLVLAAPWGFREGAGHGRAIS